MCMITYPYLFIQSNIIHVSVDPVASITTQHSMEQYDMVRAFNLTNFIGPPFIDV